MPHRWALVLVLLAAACAAQEPISVEVPLHGSAADLWVGRWYDWEGRLSMVVRSRPEGHVLLLPGVLEQAKPTSVFAETDGLVLHFAEREPVRLDRRTDPDLLPPGSDACLWLGQCAGCYYHEPSIAWLHSRAWERRVYDSERKLDGFVDWLVRTL